jgi:hypothetical protein
MILMLVQARADWTAAPCSCSGQGISAHALRHWQVKLEPYIVTPKHLNLMHTRNVIGRELTVRGGKEAVSQCAGAGYDEDDLIMILMATVKESSHGSPGARQPRHVCSPLSKNASRY